jgi:CheY-like chemotaxis protein
LKKVGYQVLTAENGVRALEILSRGGPINVVFTDLVMPGGVSGLEVATRANELKPGIKVLLTSGYPEELVPGDDLQRQQFRVLRKPYHQPGTTMQKSQHKNLTHRLHEVVDQGH